MPKQKKVNFEKIYLAAVLAFIYVPMLLVIVYSFNESKLSTVWGGFSLDWYKKLFSNRELGAAFKNSLIVAFSSSVLAAVIGTSGALGFRKYTGAVNSAAEKLAVFPLMMPEIITGLVFLLIFSAVNIKFGLLTLVIAHTSFCVPYVFMVVKGSLSQLDDSGAEAARDLGASPARAFFDVTLPSIFPSVMSGTLLSFAMSLDDVVISFFVTGAKTNTLPIKIYSQLKVGVTPEINALCTVIFAVTLVVVALYLGIGKSRGQRR